MTILDLNTYINLYKIHLFLMHRQKHQQNEYGIAYSTILSTFVIELKMLIRILMNKISILILLK